MHKRERGAATRSIAIRQESPAAITGRWHSGGGRKNNSQRMRILSNWLVRIGASHGGRPSRNVKRTDMAHRN